jgi:hypothetical protein
MQDVVLRKNAWKKLAGRRCAGCSAAAKVALLVWAAVAANQSLAANFFDVPAASPGEPMFFSIYSISPEQKGNFNLQKIAAGGFTATGPYYGGAGNPTVNASAFYTKVQDAANHGLQHIAHLPMHPLVINNTTGFVRGDSMALISEADLRQHVRDVMDFTLDDVMANATVGAWYTNPEELRPWRAEEMHYLEIVADEIKSYDPLGRPVTMYNPTHRTSSQLETIVSQGLDRTMMGVYITGQPFAVRGARAALGLDRIVTAATNTATTPTAVFQLSEDYDATDLGTLRTALGGVSEAAAIKQVIRHDVYQGLLRGVEGVQIWSGCDCRVGLTTYTEQLDGYISVSEDLNVTHQLADVFLQGERRTDFQATVLAGPSTVTFSGNPVENNGDYTVDAVTLADIAYGEQRYLFLANSSNSLLAVSVEGLPAGVPQINDLFSNAPELSVDPSSGAMTLLMQPLEVIALRIESVHLADANGDQQVDGSDFLAWQRGYGGAGATTLANGDFNYDGVVDPQDLAVWQSQSGTSAALSAAAAGVPEPATFSLVTLGMLLIGAGRQPARSAVAGLAPRLGSLAGLTDST